MKTAIILLATLLLFACEQGAKSPRGFSLPEGNAEQGYLVFKKYQCQDCHRIAGEGEDDSAMGSEGGGSSGGEGGSGGSGGSCAQPPSNSTFLA